MNPCVTALQEHFADWGIDALLVASPENRRYVSGFTGSNGVVLLHPKAHLLVTDFRYKTQAAEEATGYQVHIAGQAGGMFDPIKEAMDRLGAKKLGFESDQMTVDWADRAQRAFPGIAFVPVPGAIERLRQKKCQEEIDAIAHAQQIGDMAFSYALPQIQRGMTEHQVAALICGFMMHYGCGPSFPMIAASGPNSAMPHAVVSNRVLQDGDFLTMDFGCRYNGYCSDMTRTLAIGTPTQEMADVYHIVLSAQERAMKLICPGAECWDVDNTARSYIKENGYGEYFGHGLGHGIGLAVHEEPRFSSEYHQILEPGICISVEPGIYLPGKFGVRIEDIVCVIEEGYRNFTTSPKELIIR